MSVKVENFGCRLNALEGDVAQAAAKTAGLDKTIIINGCSVTGEALRQARQAARRAKRAGPDHEIIVTGCAAQTDGPSFAAMPEVDRVLGNEEKLDPAAYAAGTPCRKRHYGPHARNSPACHAATLARARLCAGSNRMRPSLYFCIIPFGRGNARSLPIAEVVAQCRDLVARGHGEIVLTGVDVTSYGPDIGEVGLGGLVRAILDQVPELPRLRLSSIDAVEIDPTLLDMVVHEERLMPHLHLSLQAGTT